MRILILLQSLYREDVPETFGSNIRGRHLRASSDFSEKVRYQKFLEHLYINFVPVSEFSLENVKIKMKLVVKYNLLKYADNKLIILNI